MVSGNTNHLTIETNPQVDMLTLKKSLSDKVGCETKTIIAMVITGVPNEILFAKDNLDFPRNDFAVRSGQASLTSNPDRGVLYPDQRAFSDTNGKEMNVLRLNSNTKRNGIDNIRGNVITLPYFILR